MEIEPSNNNNSKIISKKIWNVFRIIPMMIKKGISKSKLIKDLNLLLKRGNELSGRAINGLIIHHNALICKPKTFIDQSIMSPKEYEFSCSSTPELGPFQPVTANQKKFSWLKPNNKRYSYNLEDPTTFIAVQRVLEMLNSNEGAGPLTSPLGMGNRMSRPEFGVGKSHQTRQLRITDSPFPIRNRSLNHEELEEDLKVNEAADEFIKRFYNNLKMQKCLESPCHTLN